MLSPVLIKILLASATSNPRRPAAWPCWSQWRKTRGKPWSLLQPFLPSSVLCCEATSLLLQGKFEDHGVARMCVRSLWAAGSPFPGVGNRKSPDGSQSHFEPATTFLCSPPSFKLWKEKICCGGNPFSKSQGGLPDLPVFLCSNFVPQHSGQLDGEGLHKLQVSEIPLKPVSPRSLSPVFSGEFCQIFWPGPVVLEEETLFVS